MTVDWNGWSAAFAGGLMIGAAALLLFGALGRIAGISGTVYGALDAGARHWRLAFLGGLVAGGWLALLLGAPLPLAPEVRGVAGAALPVLGGLIVGFGTRLGHGCTSGHGVCGLARLSPRSLAAVCTFMGVGMVTATLLRLLGGAA